MQDVEPLPSKRPNLASDPSSSSHFSRTNSSGSYSEASAVPPELRSQLESIGMRTRFNVNRGYARPILPLQQVELQQQPFSASNRGFQTERQVLQGVLGSKERWSRTKSAPMRHSPAAALSSNGSSSQEAMSPLGLQQPLDGGEMDLKRAREDVFAEFMDEEDDDDQSMTASASSHGSKPIRSLPQRSGGAFNTTMTLPASSDLASYLAHGQGQARQAHTDDMQQDENWRTVDFSSFAKQHDF